MNNSKKKNTWKTPTLLALLLSASGLSAQCGEHKDKVNIAAPVLNFIDIENNTINGPHLLKTKPMYLFFFNPYDPTGIAEVNQAFVTYKDKIEFVGVTPAMNLNVPWLKAYVEDYGIQYSVVFDHDNQLFRQFDAWQHPKHILVDKKGLIHYQNNVRPKNLAEMLAIMNEGK